MYDLGHLHDRAAEDGHAEARASTAALSAHAIWQRALAAWDYYREMDPPTKALEGGERGTMASIYIVAYAVAFVRRAIELRTSGREG